MENIDISNIKINIDIISYEESKLKVSIQNIGKSPVPGYFYSFKVLIDDKVINDIQPNLNLLENTNLYIISNSLKYLNSDGYGHFVVSNLIKPDKMYYHTIDLSCFNLNLRNKINIESINEFKLKNIIFYSTEFEQLFKNEIFINYNIYTKSPKSNTLVLVKNILNNSASKNKDIVKENTIELNNIIDGKILNNNTIELNKIVDGEILNNNIISVTNTENQNNDDNNNIDPVPISTNTISTNIQNDTITDPCAQNAIAGVSCDPHVLTFGGNRLELPNNLNFYNLLTKNDLIINGETGYYNDEVIMKSIFIDYNNKKFLINLETLEYNDLNNNFLIKRIGTKTLEIYTYDKEYKFIANSEKFGFIVESENNMTQNDTFGIFMSNSFEDSKIKSFLNSNIQINKFINIKNISQVNISSKLKYYIPRYQNDYNDNYDSVLFYGMYDLDDIDRCVNHKGDVYIYWHRNDTLPNNNIVSRNLKKIKKIKKNIVHLHNDKVTERNLREVGIISNPL